MSDSTPYAYFGWFGQSWHAPVNEDTPQVPIPIGELCERCEERITADDSGMIIPCIGGSRPWLAYHRECNLLGLVGHSVGVCRCTSYLGLSVRAAGREVVRRVEAGHVA
jgi:hypothetical protein